MKKASASQYLAPSAVHFVMLEQMECPSITLPDSICPRHMPRLQVVCKDNAWFALNSAQLQLCRELEQSGQCDKVPVDIVSLHRVPPKLRNLMVIKQTPPNSLRDIGPKTDTSKEEKTHIRDSTCELPQCEEKQTVEDKPRKDSESEQASGTHTARGYHAVVQRDPHEELSEQSDDSEESSSDNSDCHSIHTDSASELGYDGWSEEASEGDTDGDSYSSDSSESGSTLSKDRLDENDSLL